MIFVYKGFFKEINCKMMAVIKKSISLNFKVTTIKNIKF